MSIQRKLHGFCAFLVVADLAFGTLLLQPLDVFESAFNTKYKLRIDLQPFCP